MQQNCCYREKFRDSDRCIWHVDSDEVKEKPIQELKQTRAPPEIREKNSPYAELLDGAKLQGLKLTDAISFEDTALRDADFRNTKLYNANFNDANLFKANLTNASFIGSKLTNAFLEECKLTNTNFHRAKMVNAHLDITDLNNVSLWGANLTAATFRETTLNDVNLYDATIKGGDMKYIEINDVELNQSTTFGQQTRGEKDAESASDWDLIAQAYHEVKMVCTEHGFVSKARDLHVWERRARSLEAKSADGQLSGWLNSTYLASLLSRIFTGYGVRMRYISFWMVVLFLFSTMWYAFTAVEETLISNFTYSVITFTTAPPHVPSEFWTQIVVMVETFFGTLAIVLLGYILGNRGQF